MVVSKGINSATSDYGMVLQTLQELAYGTWRDADPADTLRFYALRLREAGMIRATPQAIIDRGADWTFLRSLKAELEPPRAAATWFTCRV
jgi:NitT/TauT family transport system substrate-binding protein